jgi:hypothetical protein
MSFEVQDHELLLIFRKLYSEIVLRYKSMINQSELLTFGFHAGKINQKSAI